MFWLVVEEQETHGPRCPPDNTIWVTIVNRTCWSSSTNDPILVELSMWSNTMFG